MREIKVYLFVGLLAVLAGFVILQQQKVRKFENDDKESRVQEHISAWKSAFQEAENWRRDVVSYLYKDMTDEDWEKAYRWKAFVEYEDPLRSCSAVQNDLDENLINECVTLFARSTWNDQSRLTFLAEYIFHSTGIEGNTLSLAQTYRILDNQKLFHGFEDHLASPSTGPSIQEVRNLNNVLEDLKIYQRNLFEWNSLSMNSLNNIHAQIVQDLGVGLGIRKHAAAVGVEHTLLPMPDELPFLVQEFIDWFNVNLAEIIEEGSVRDKVNFASDAHVRFVHIHPFADGNGRLARIIDGIASAAFGLPPPIFSRNDRAKYMTAISQATIRKQYQDICDLHTQAIYRSCKVVANANQSN